MAVYVADAGFYGFDGCLHKETLTNGSYVQTLIGSGWGAPFAVAVDATLLFCPNRVSNWKDSGAQDRVPRFTCRWTDWPKSWPSADRFAAAYGAVVEVDSSVGVLQRF
jgi:hypothetical protein